MSKWAHLENIAILAAMCFLVWLTGSPLWCLLSFLFNFPRLNGGKG